MEVESERAVRKSKVKELCGSSGLPASNCPYDLPRGRKATVKVDWSDSEVRSCVKVEVDALGFPGVPNSSYGLCGRKATVKKK